MPGPGSEKIAATGTKFKFKGIDPEWICGLFLGQACPKWRSGQFG
jgi:hypothetical protein